MEDGTYIKREDGTVDNYGNHWAYGYIVGVQNVAVYRQDAITTELLGDDAPEFLSELAVKVLPPHKLFGVWTDSDGSVYVDYVEHVDTLSAALSKARERGELAIWDMRNGVEIRVTDDVTYSYAKSVSDIWNANRVTDNQDEIDQSIAEHEIAIAREDY